MSRSVAVGHFTMASAVRAGRYLRSRRNSYSNPVSKSPTPLAERTSGFFESMTTKSGSRLILNFSVKLYSTSRGKSNSDRSLSVSNSKLPPTTSGSSGFHVSEGDGLVRITAAETGCVAASMLMMIAKLHRKTGAASVRSFISRSFMCDGHQHHQITRRGDFFHDANAPGVPFELGAGFQHRPLPGFHVSREHAGRNRDGFVVRDDLRHILGHVVKVF